MKKIQITTELQPNVTLLIDNNKITKLLDNILSNAIKYNKVNGYISIHLQSNTLTIKDSGKGIAKQDIAQMFERYARFDTTVGGFGIGLNIVKMICKEYNLKIQINSELGKWTEVSISW